jgi:spore germination protein KC
MHLLRRWMGVILIMLALICLTGCAFSGFKDIDKRFFVMAIGVDESDKFEKGYKVSLKLAIPAEEKAASGNFVLVSEEAPTITEAVRKMKAMVDKEIDFGHTKILIFSKAIMKRNLKQTMNWFFHRRDIQLISWIAMGEPSAEAVLKVKTKSERLAANALFLSFAQLGTESDYILTQYFFDFHRRLFEDGIDPIAPIIKAEKEGFTIDQAVVFDKRMLKYELSPQETKWLNIITGKANKSDIKVKEGERYFQVSADDLNITYKIGKDKENKPTLHIEGSIVGIIEEYKQGGISIADLEKYSRLTSEAVEEDVINVVTKLQKENIDPIGFGLRYRAYVDSTERGWQNWKDMYGYLSVTASIEAKIMGTGISK